MAIAYVEGYPADRLVRWDVRLLDQLQCQRLVVELDCDDDARRRPGADHEMVLHGAELRPIQSIPASVQNLKLQCPALGRTTNKIKKRGNQPSGIPPVDTTPLLPRSSSESPTRGTGLEEGRISLHPQSSASNWATGRADCGAAPRASALRRDHGHGKQPVRDAAATA